MPIDYKQYPDNWKTEIVPAIRQRSGNICEGSPVYPDCRAVNGLPHPVTGSTVVLTTAHFDQDKKNNQYSPDDKNAPGNNLYHWCQRCHLTHDKGQHISNRKFGRNWKDAQSKLDM